MIYFHSKSLFPDGYFSGVFGIIRDKCPSGDQSTIHNIGSPFDAM